MNKMFLSLLIIFVLSACTPTLEPTPAPIPTPLPTATPIPEPITGTTFWDANGSGLQDETSFITPEFDPSDPPYFFELLAANGTGIGNLSPGELATVPEPPIPGIGVCLGEVCTETDASGAFTLQPEKVQETYYLKFSDLHADDPAKAFRYINKWNGPVVIEGYEINDVTIPVQHLNDTEVVSIGKGFDLSGDENTTIGLMQGYLTLPFSKENEICVINFFDLEGNEFDSKVRDWQGSTIMRIDPTECTPGKVADWHCGIDYAYGEDYAEFIEFIVLSSANGSLLPNSPDPKTTPGFGSVRLKHFDQRHTDYAHLGRYLHNSTGQISRGLILGSISIDWDGPHLHFELMGKPNEGRLQWNFWRIDIYREQSDPDSISYWTVDNIPQFPLVGIIE